MNEAVAAPADLDDEFVPRLALAIAFARYAIPLIALPFIPLLFPDHIESLLLIKPTKDVVLASGWLTRIGRANGALAFAAYLPLMLFANWAFFFVGRAYGERLRRGEGPGWLTRALPPDRFDIADRVLVAHGPAIAVIGRVAALPPTILAAAAGTSAIETRRYLLADAAGAVIAFGTTFSAGLALGEAYQRAGLWLSAASLLLMLGLVAVLARWVRRAADAHARAEDRNEH